MGVIPIEKGAIAKLCAQIYEGESMLVGLRGVLNFRPLLELVSLGKVVLGFALEVYTGLEGVLDLNATFKEKPSDLEGYWAGIQENYGAMAPLLKVKSYNFMDSLETKICEFGEQLSTDQGLVVGRKRTTKLVLLYHVLKYLEVTLETPNDYIRGALLQIKEGLVSWAPPAYLEGAIQDIQSALGAPNETLALSSELFNVLEVADQEARKSLLGLARLTFRAPHDSARRHAEDGAEDCLSPVEVFRFRQDGLRGFALNRNQGQGLEAVLLLRRGIKKVEVCESLILRNRTQDGSSLLHEDSFSAPPQQVPFDRQTKHSLPLIQEHYEAVLSSRRLLEGQGLVRTCAHRQERDPLRQPDALPYMDPNELHSLESHHYLPWLLVGGKALIEVVPFSSLKPTHRLHCPTQTEIQKILSLEHRVTALDASGSVCAYALDSRLQATTVYSLRKGGVLDVVHPSPSPSLLGILQKDSLQLIDTLLNPKRQSAFSAKLSGSSGLGAVSLGGGIMGVLKKTEIILFDVRRDRQLLSRDLDMEAKCVSYTQSVSPLISLNRFYSGKLSLRCPLTAHRCEPHSLLAIGGTEAKVQLF